MKLLPLWDGVLLKGGSRCEPQVNKGDRVMFSSNAGSEISIDPENLLIMTEADILAVIS